MLTSCLFLSFSLSISFFLWISYSQPSQVMYSLFFFHFENEIKVNSDKINLMTLKKTIGLYNRIRNEECTELLKTIIAASLSILNEFK